MPAPNVNAVGAQVQVFRAGERMTGRPFLTEMAHPDSTPIHVGLGKQNTFALWIAWPDKKVVEWKNVESRDRLEITPDGKLVPVAKPK